MTKVRTFSRVFPSYHPRAGEPTYFVEKIWKSFYDQWGGDVRDLLYYQEKYDEIFYPDGQVKNIHNFQPKHHTIRAGHHFKPGDWFSPRVWSGVPYKSKQITIAPDIQVKKVWDFMVNVSSPLDPTKPEIEVRLNNEVIYYESVGGLGGSDLINEIALNDGLSVDDFTAWFNYFYAQFDGQIICWNENINY